MDKKFDKLHRYCRITMVAWTLHLLPIHILVMLVRACVLRDAKAYAVPAQE